MNTFSIPVLLALCAALNLPAQNFPLQGNEKWAYNQWQTASIPPGGCTIDTWRFYELNGDTLLNGAKWFRLFQAVYVEIYCTFPSSHSESFVAPTANGFLRDSADVWLYRDSASASPKILFSFGLQTGENFFPNDVCLVEQISETNAIPPRRIESQIPPFGNGLATKLIEGVGSVHSFFLPACFSCYSSECQFAINLKCFKQDSVEIPLGIFQECVKSETIYQKILDYQMQSPTLEAGIAQHTGLRLMPSPSSDKVKLEFSGGDIGSDFRVDVFDQTGKLSFSQTHFSSLELDVSSWNPGIYVVRVFGSGNGQLGYGRFVKL